MVSDNRITLVKAEEASHWDKIVRSFNNYDVQYLNGYARAFQIHGDGDPVLLYYEDDSTRAINVAMIRDIARSRPFCDVLPPGKYFDISTPYGYGGFLIEGDNYQAVNEAYNRYCYEHGYISEFVRFHLLNGYQTYYDGIRELKSQNVIRNLELPLDSIFMDFEHRTRKSIKKALNGNLSVEIDHTGQKLEDFLNVYYSTMQRTNASQQFFFSKQFFHAINSMTDHIVYFHILHEGKVVSTELVIYGPENCYSFLGGTDENYFHLNPNSLLKYEVIKWAKEKGLKRYVLGGGYGANDGIFTYKKGFSPRGIVDYYIGKKIFRQDIYDELVTVRMQQDVNFDKNHTYFPLYRA
jgi:hypothetical protein